MLLRAALEKTFVSHDGTELFYRHWPLAASGGARRAVVLFHRGHEHSGRLQYLVDELAIEGADVFAWDARGHGRSPGARGDSPSLSASVKDVDRFMRHIHREYGIAPDDTAIVAQSIAAVLVATWVHDYAPAVRCLVLSAPAFKVKLYVPFAQPGLTLLHRVRGNFYITSYVKARFLTQDPERIRSYEEDPLITRAISVRVLLGLAQAAERIVADAQAIRVPILLLVSDRDWVVHRAPQDEFFDRLGSSIKERVLLPGFLHDILGERDRKFAIDKVRDFICHMFAVAPALGSMRDADKAGYSHDEERRLLEPLPTVSMRNLRFALTRISMRTLGRLSAGIRVGLESGFDSGRSLDYVYDNRAQGDLVLGKIIDRGYLNAIGWRGVRVRKQHLIEAIQLAACRLHAEGLPVRIADIAAGQGRYVLDAIETLPAAPQAVVLRDYDESNVRAGRALIERKQLAHLATFERADAFDPTALESLTPKPTLVVVSGLYELFSENSLIARSLGGIAQHLSRGGYLVYTGQPWHPQIELIARTLTSHREHRPWVMRRRSQAELDELTAACGFSKIEQWIDHWGMFTVSLAVKA